MSAWDKEQAPARVKAILKALGRNQYQLAQALGISQVTVCRWSTGRNAPGAKAQEKLELLEARFVKRKPEEEN